MKYLQPKKSGVKITIAPSKVVTVPMFNVVRVDEDRDEVSILSLTGAEMIYLMRGKIKVKKQLIDKILEMDKEFKITNEFDFIKI